MLGLVAGGNSGGRRGRYIREFVRARLPYGFPLHHAPIQKPKGLLLI
jgi:hypothetical protein